MNPFFLYPTMHSSINYFLFFFVLVIFCNPKYMGPLLLSSSAETKLFELHSLPHGYLTFLGDAHLRHNAIVLTEEGMRSDAARSAGVVFYSHPILFRDSHSKKIPSFYTTFAFSIENVHGNDKALGDGLAFLISPHNDLLGSPGYLGLMDSTGLKGEKFIAIEFDTKRDSVFHDPNDNHVGLDINNLFSVKLATATSAGVNLKSGNLISTWIDYKSDEEKLEVFLSYSYLKPKIPLLKLDVDLSHYLKENMFVGFSASTEGSMQYIRIQQWEFTILESSPPPPPPPPELGRTFPNPSESVNRHGHLSRVAIGLIIAVISVSFLVIFCGFCWKKLMESFLKIEGTNNLMMQTIRSPGGISCQDIQLSILVNELAKGLNIGKVSDSEVEYVHVKTVNSSIPLCNILSAVKPSIVPLCNGFPQRANEITQSDGG